jgi:hypothetical protein
LFAGGVSTSSVEVGVAKKEFMVIIVVSIFHIHGHYGARVARQSRDDDLSWLAKA